MNTGLRLELVRFTEKSAEPLLEAIEKSLPDKDGYAHSPRYAPLNSLINHLLQLGAVCAIAQREVQDPDFMAEHAAYYTLMSQDVPRYCTRFHFFSADPETDDALVAIDKFADAEGEHYLGFFTLRPVRMSPIGASIVRVPPEDSALFVLAVDKFPVHLAGREFEITGTPFMQQDSAVGACAQASIWMALRTMRARAGHSAYNPAEITSAATRFLAAGRTYPSKGLGVTQITEAIRATGYAPHLLILRNDETAVDDDALDVATAQIYPYVESKIPVLLILLPGGEVGHAVIAIGHGWNPSPTNLKPIAQSESSKKLFTAYDSAKWIEPFVIHNDNSGPYQLLTRDPAKGYNLAQAYYAIPFLPPDVFLDGAEARELALRLLEGCLSDIDESQGQEGTARPPIVLRTYLQDRSAFREAVYASDMPDDLKNYYRMKWLPKRVWVTEINALDGYEGAPAGSSMRLGEVVVDPTASMDDGNFLSIHLSPQLLHPTETTGVVIDRDRQTRDIKALPVGAAKYSPLVRKS